MTNTPLYERLLSLETGSYENICNLNEHENQQNHMWFCTADEKPRVRHVDPGQSHARHVDLVSEKSRVILFVLVFIYIAHVLI